MTTNRIELHEALLAASGLEHIYFQPPESLQLRYPCIIYNINNVRSRYADNGIYSLKTEYSVTVVDADPDNTTALKLMEKFHLCRFDRRYTANNLYHDALTLYF